MQITVNIIRRGLVGGFYNPITGEEFVAPDGDPGNPQVQPLRSKKAELYRAAVDSTAATIFDITAEFGARETMEEYKALYPAYLETLES